MITLGIETSCDETALAILETKQEGAGLQYRIVSSLINSQADLHREYGGVYPTLAKREHGRNLLPLLRKILIESAQIGPSRHVMDDNTFQTKIANIKSKYVDKNSDLVDSIVDIDFLRHVPNIDRIAIT